MNSQFTSNLIESKYNYPINVFGKKSDELKYYTINYNNIFHGDISFIKNLHSDNLQKRLQITEHIFCNELKSDSEINPQLNYFGLDFLRYYSPEIIYIFESIIINSFPTLFFSKGKNNLNCLYAFLFEESRNQKYMDTVKVKISPELVKNDDFMATLNSLMSNPEIKKFRFDGNMKFSSDDLLKFYYSLNNLHLHKIEYFEDCCKTFEQSLEFSKNTNTTLGIDESINTFLNDYLTNEIFPTKAVMILRPSLLGITQSINIINQLAKSNIPSIISSSYETEGQQLGLIYLATYSNLVNKQKLYHGLDPINAIPSTNLNYKIHGNKIEIQLLDTHT